MKLAVVALGGNAIAPPSGPLMWTGQLDVARRLTPLLLALHEREYRLVVTHGNGPQVGAILSQNEIAAGEVPASPLDVLVAQSQAQIGYALQVALLEAWGREGWGGTPVALVTLVAVDQKDPEFHTPSKPIGPLVPESRARELERLGATMAEDPRGGFRRLVPSPWPQEVLGASQIRGILEEVPLVIAAGGGGVPVVQEEGSVRGIEAVVDKDLTSSLLATELGAELLLLLTDVPHVYLDFGTEAERALMELTAREAEGHLLNGQFPPGTMGPKVRGAVDFLDGGGQVAIIVDQAGAISALNGEAGTRIRPGRPRTHS
ncbi:MAG: carbamate kinase [Thermoplasmata archaeon]